LWIGHVLGWHASCNFTLSVERATGEVTGDGCMGSDSGGVLGCERDGSLRLDVGSNWRLAMTDTPANRREYVTLEV
jgi:hypothetical protein